MYLVNDMLDVYMLKNGKFMKIQEEIRVEEMMAKIYEMFCIQMEQKGVGFEIKIYENVPLQFTSDQRRMMQVIINLTQNALKFTSNGSITIEVRFEESTKMFLISVCDTGIGIRKCDQVKIFKMFGKLNSSNK